MGCKQICQPSLGEHVIFIMLKSKQTSPMLQRETLPLSSKAVVCANILEKIIWSKGSHGFCLQDVQKHERPTANHLPIAATFDFFSTLLHKSPNRCTYFSKPLTKPKLHAERYKGQKKEESRRYVISLFSYKVYLQLPLPSSFHSCPRDHFSSE